ncbi:Ig-like domain-containing protein [Enterococcus larvae]|uniref:Ig-like domain-containing protein n=1 Tax=Enterococcus larvae TaxID=2794352 RepID=UPI003F2D0AF1
MKKIVSFIGLVICFFAFNPMVVFAGEENDWIEYDVATGKQTIVPFSEVQIEGIPESLEAASPASKKAARASNIGIIGEDDRMKVEDTTLYPYSTVVKTVAVGNGHGGGQGSGSLISSDTVLTCAHAVFNAQNGFANVEVIPGAATSEPKQPFGRIVSKKVYVPKSYLTVQNRDNDIAVIKLETAIGNTTGWLGLAYFEGHEYYGEFTQTGYPGMFSGDMYTETRETSLLSHSTEHFSSYFDSTSGNSGSPLYDSQQKVYGICISGDEYNGIFVNSVHSRVTKDKYAMIYHLINQAVPVEKIELDSTEMTILPKKLETKKINATIYPDNATNKSIQWNSSDSSVATVDKEGSVTGISDGTCIISATTQDGAFVTSCEIFVKDDHGNTSDSATKVEINKEYTGKIDYATDKDYFFSEIDIDQPFVIISTEKVSQVMRKNSTNNGWTSGVMRASIEENNLFYTCISYNSKGYKDVRFYFEGSAGTNFSFKIVPLENNEKPVPEQSVYTIQVDDVLSLNAEAKNGLTNRIDYSLWSSNNPYIKLDKDGNVTGLTPGEATVTVTDSLTGAYTTVKIIVEMVDDHGDNFEEATQIEIGKEYFGKIDYKNDLDYFTGHFDGNTTYAIVSTKKIDGFSYLNSSNTWSGAIYTGIQENGTFYYSSNFNYNGYLKDSVGFKIYGTLGETYSFKVIPYTPEAPTAPSTEITVKIGETKSIDAVANNGLTKLIVYKNSYGNIVTGKISVDSSGNVTGLEKGTCFVNVQDPLSDKYIGIWVKVIEG